MLFLSMMIIYLSIYVILRVIYYFAEGDSDIGPRDEWITPPFSPYPNPSMFLLT